MRYDTPVYFQLHVSGKYDPTTGNYGDPTVEETKVYANVTDARTDKQHLEYGDALENRKVVRLQRPYTKPFTSIRIGDTKYKLAGILNMSISQSFTVSEVK